jgi:hypothetical protein
LGGLYFLFWTAESITSSPGTPRCS